MPTHQPITDLTFVCQVCSREVTEPRIRRRTVNVSCHDCRAGLRKRQYAANRIKAKEYTRSWRENNPEKAALVALKIKAYHFDHREELREYRRLHAHQRRAKYVGKFSIEDVLFILKRQKGKCANPLCNILLEGNYHIDHVMPIALGGANTADNLQILCPTCNHHKSAKDPYKWAQSVGRLFV